VPSTPFDLNTVGFAHGGEAIAKKEGKVIFIRGALPDEKVSVQLTEEHRRYARGQLLEVLVPSPHRRPLDCLQESAGCGGCGMRMVKGLKGLELKAKAAVSTAEKLSPTLNWPRPEIHPLSQYDGVRARLRLHLEDGRLGFYARASHSLLPAAECKNANPKLIEVISNIESAIGSRKEKSQPEWLLLEIVDNATFLFWPGPVSHEQQQKLGNLVQTSQLEGVRIKNRQCDIIFGSKWITESCDVGDKPVKFYRKIGTFGQANPEANAQIRAALLKILQPLHPSRILELFSGSGNLTIPSALNTTEIVAVESEKDALDGLIKTVEANQLYNIRGYRRDLNSGLTKHLIDFQPDTVLLNPPREGARQLMKQIARLEPQNILYLSCSPPHLGRDAAALGEMYKINKLEIFDNFPRTPHVEMLAHFSKRKIAHDI
jgi:23S rRNA (uracil1939-C5)-methyltransferase